MAGPLTYAGWVSGSPEGLMLAMVAALCIGIWRIFRPTSRRAAAAAIGTACMLLATAVLIWLADHAGRSPTAHAAYRVGYAGRIASFAWVAYESLRYAAMLRRREALGLAEPMMVHRFRCWGVSAGATGTAYVIYLTFVVRESLPPAPVQLVLGLLGTIAALGLFVAFFPPRFVERAVASRDPA